MDPKIRNFDTIEDFIRENPQSAQAFVAEWNDFHRRHPDAPDDLEHLLEWAAKNGLSTDDVKRFYVGKEIQEAYAYIHPQQQTEPTSQQLPPVAHPLNVLSIAVPIAILLGEPELMEDHSAYKKIADQKKKEWLKTHSTKDFSNKEGLDYLYGSLDDPTLPTLAKDTEKLFREKHPHTAKRYDERKIKIDPDKNKYQYDPAFSRALQIANEHADARLELLKKENPNLSKSDLKKKREEILAQTTKLELNNFVEQYPQKAALYARQNPQIANALHEKNVRDLKAQQRQYANLMSPSGLQHLAQGKGLSTEQQQSLNKLQSLTRAVQSPITYDPNKKTTKNTFWQNVKDSLRKKPKEEKNKDQSTPPPRRQPGAFTRTMGRGLQAVNAISNPRAAAMNYAADYAMRQARKRFLNNIEERVAKFLAKQALRAIGSWALPAGAIGFVIIIVLLQLSWVGSPTATAQVLPIPGLTLTQSDPCPDDPASGGKTCVLNIGFDAAQAAAAGIQINQIVISFKVPQDVEFINATGNFTPPGCTTSNTTDCVIKWNLGNNYNSATNNAISVTFRITNPYSKPQTKFEADVI